MKSNQQFDEQASAVPGQNVTENPPLVRFRDQVKIVMVILMIAMISCLIGILILFAKGFGSAVQLTGLLLFASVVMPIWMAVAKLQSLRNDKRWSDL